MNTYPPETVEYVRLKPVTVEGTTYTSLEYALTVDDDRPTSWAATSTVDGKQAFLIDHLPVGAYTVWIRVTTAASEHVVINAGQFRIR